jgi:CubicO group peptidase (beta-lactamase class C family)
MENEIQVHGYCDERFSHVKDVFAESFKLGLDVGASFAATLKGKFVVDIWAGYEDAANTKPWEKDTIINVFSTIKIMATICTLMLVDHGLLDLDAPVVQYWPEFAQNGKEKLPVRYLLSHTSGLAGWNEKFPFEGLYDWNLCVSKLAAQKPFWKPGTKSGYHAITFGYLLGELVRRISGKSFGTFFRLSREFVAL